MAAAVPDQAPDADFLGPWTAGEDAATQSSVTLTGLDAVDHWAGGFLRWTKPNGQTAFSVSQGSIVTVT